MDKGQARFSVKERLKSIKYSLNGLKTSIKEEHNIRVHLIVSLVVIILGAFFNISAIEWIIICLCIGFVIALELLNSSIENLCDLVSPEYNKLIEKAKDMSAAAVLVSALISVIIGVIVFLPKILILMTSWKN